MQYIYKWEFSFITFRRYSTSALCQDHLFDRLEAWTFTRCLNLFLEKVEWDNGHLVFLTIRDSLLIRYRSSRQVSFMEWLLSLEQRNR